MHRFQKLGVPENRLSISGNVKFDQPDSALHSQEKKLRNSCKIHGHRQVILAGSTHKGEEAILCDAFRQLRERIPDLLLIIAPRDPKRAGAVRGIFSPHGFSTALATELPSEMPTDVIVIDVIGMLRQMYAIADIAFIGGSLVKRGGHNPIEPAVFAKPILFGPNMSDFREIADLLLSAGGAQQVFNAESLCQSVLTLLTHDSDRKEEMGLAAHSVFNTNRGAVQRTLNVVDRFL